MNINVRMEGGIGDHLLSNRFVPAILDKYPSAKIKIFSDTENNPKMLDILMRHFSYLYERGGEVIEKRQNKNFAIRSQFGTENYPCAIENQLAETMQKLMDCDKFYDLHIDGLKWLHYDFDWLRYYYYFPKPTNVPSSKYKDPYILTHLYARPDSVYNLDQSYVVELLKKLSANNRVVVLTTKDHAQYYEEVSSNSNITIDSTSDMNDIFGIASQCSAFLGIDSGIRYIPYYFSKPTFVFSQYCQSYGSVIHSHLIRWLLYTKNVLPVNVNIDAVCRLMENIKKHPAYSLFPEIPSDIENFIVERQYEPVL